MGATPGKTPETPERPEMRSQGLSGKEWGPLCDLFRNGDVKLVKGSFLKDLAVSETLLPRHQSIESKHFATPDESIRALGAGSIVAISYAWLSKEHPDPKGFYLEYFNPHHEKYEWTPFGRFGGIEWCWMKFDTEVLFFWDFASLPQWPRDPEEDKRFKRGLAYMHYMYGHANIRVWIWDDVDKEAENCTPYGYRGWPLFESVIAFAKPARTRDDHGRQALSPITPVVVQQEGGFAIQHPPPMSVKDFNSEVKKRIFSNGSDHEYVMFLYEEFWLNNLCLMKAFSRTAGGWDDQAILQLQAMLPQLTELKDVRIGVHQEGLQNHVSEEVREEFRKVCFRSGIRVMLWNTPKGRIKAYDDYRAQMKSPEAFGALGIFGASTAKTEEETDVQNFFGMQNFEDFFGFSFGASAARDAETDLEIDLQTQVQNTRRIVREQMEKRRAELPALKKRVFKLSD